ncbi:MAG TPA: zf-HC2 domain-containing protein [Pyrinomonadaceae bacterium]|nr:zf-HC2 domain-containing protein [Pyrinomonadaceae bacterium]
MNCEICQELIGDLVDGTLSRDDESKLNLHLEQCLDCAEVRADLQSIVGYCRTHRGEYTAPPNERALWLRIVNVIEAENQSIANGTSAAQPAPVGFLSRWLHRSWEVSLPQLAASAAAIIVVVSIATTVGLRRWDSTRDNVTSSDLTSITQVRDRLWQQRQAIEYWNQRVEVNKARWSQEMRDTFDRNLKVIDEAVNASLSELNKNPHDEVSEEMLNAALNEKLALLREFSDL